MSKPSTAHIAAAKHLLRYLAGTLNFAITYNQGDLKLMAAFSAVDWGNKPSNGKSMSSSVVFLPNGPASSTWGFKG